ncbi:Glycosyltransferase involved in cell wall bisynthesis [Jatrophihabitans endophyticus]|uniref:Glycosyltransferase involved in cell wall bisynthesis n=1 Tax=Jatrophihabitans endophyticus TaxID=1206085 RepID=A0A1M5IK43_9ACTN|nr:Glycosyltransferase involved in cell wall bisynthesis [Jatrophihabitans endophyticus]
MRIGVDGRVLVDRYHGIGRVTFELLSILVDDPQLEFVIFVDPGEPAHRFDVSSLRRPNVRFVDFPVPLPSPVQFARWPLVLRREPVDLMLFPYQLGACPVGGPRQLTIVHDCLFEQNQTYAPTHRVAALHRRLTGLLLRRAAVVVPSRATAADVERFYGVRVPADHVVEWGVSPRFAAAPTDPTARPPVTGPYLLHVGARRPHKRVPFLVRVLARLDPSMQLALVGSADDRWPDHTMKVAAELGVADRVHDLSEVTDTELLTLYRHAHAFAYPSVTEGFGLPLLEAMAAGAPVVASDVPVFREIGADAAEFAPLRDAGRWAAAIERVGDPAHRARLVERGAALAREATWTRAAGQLGALLRGVPAGGDT